MRIIYLPLALLLFLCGFQFVNSHPPYQSSLLFRYPKNKLLYLHIFKNASTFTRRVFDEPFLHEPPSALSDDIKKTYTKLLIVRDPYTRAISSYQEVLKARQDGPSATIHYPFFLNREDPTLSFIQFLSTIENNFYDNHCKPQKEVFDAMGFSLKEIDFIVDFDHLMEDLNIFSKTFHIPINLEQGTYSGNKSVKNTLKKLVEEKEDVREKIRRVYHMDFDFVEKALKRRAEILEQLSKQVDQTD